MVRCAAGPVLPRDILAKAGYVETAQDWDGWLRMAMPSSANDPTTSCSCFCSMADMLITMLSQTGATMLSDQDTRGDFQTPEVRNAFTYYARIFAEGLAPKALSTEIQDR